MNPQNIITDEEQKVGDDIPTLKSKIAKLEKILQAMELELVKKKKKGLKTYRIFWSKTYYGSGTVEITAPTEEEAIQIVKDNIWDYDASFSLEYDPKDDYIQSHGEVEE